MARKVLTVKEKIERSKIKVNWRYSATVKEIVELCKSDMPIDAMYDAFSYGYIQGVKAARAEIRRTGV